jgi:hypothetical protein
MIKARLLMDQTSCLNKAGALEPVFLLRANDPLAAATVRLWAAMAVNTHEEPKVYQALEWADMAEKWLGSQTQTVKAVPQPAPAQERYPR